MENKIREWEFRIRVVNGVKGMGNDGNCGGIEVNGRNIEGGSNSRSPRLERVINEEMRRKCL